MWLDLLVASGWGCQLWSTAQFSLPITYNKARETGTSAARHTAPAEGVPSLASTLVK